MPLALNPDLTFDLSLESDKAMPARTRPAFVCRHLTGRAWQKVTQITDAIDEADTGSLALDKIVEALSTGMVGWKNMGGLKFGPGGLLDVLTPQEMNELLGKMLKGGQPDGDDLGKSVSRPKSKRARSATNAPAAGVSTRRQK